MADTTVSTSANFRERLIDKVKIWKRLPGAPPCNEEDLVLIAIYLMSEKATVAKIFRKIVEMFPYYRRMVVDDVLRSSSYNRDLQGFTDPGTLLRNIDFVLSQPEIPFVRYPPRDGDWEVGVPHWCWPQLLSHLIDGARKSGQ